jgi:hypothetical protein
MAMIFEIFELKLQTAGEYEKKISYSAVEVE